MSQVMQVVRLSKVVLNIGVGKAGEPLERAKRVLKELTGREPGVTSARKTIRDFGIHEGEPIGTMVTLRREDAGTLLRRLIAAKDSKLASSSFDQHGNVSFGIKEHIDIEG